MSKTHTSARMARLVARWRTSGESGARFARRHQIPAWTFWYWCRKLSAEPVRDTGQTRATTFVPVQVAAEPETPVIEIGSSRGDRLQVRAGASPELVRSAVLALQSAC